MPVKSVPACSEIRPFHSAHKKMLSLCHSTASRESTEPADVFMSRPKKARLSWILVLEWFSWACCALVDPVLFRIEACEQFGQHPFGALRLG